MKFPKEEIMPRPETCDLLLLPHPMLSTKCQYINIDDLDMKDYVDRAIDRMTTVMMRYDGIGLAANQIGIPFRIVVSRASGSIKSYINLDFLGAPAGEENLITNEEGCLSIPNYYADIERYNVATFTHTPFSMIEEYVTLEGLECVCLQHEIDHLNGFSIATRYLSQQKRAK